MPFLPMVLNKVAFMRIRTIISAFAFLSVCTIVSAQTIPPDRGAPPGIRPTPGVTLPPVGAPMSRAYGVILDSHFANNPPRASECSRAVHDRYWNYGADGKVYPSWHPPVDPITGCAFGHEHGDDPKQYLLDSQATNYHYAMERPVVFGYANERLYDLDRVNFRDEDHVGHKIMIANNMPYGGAGVPNGIRCGMMVKYHQGTHSADAMSNNLHEVVLYANCNNGMFTRWSALQPFGRPSFVETNCTPGNNNFGYVTGPAVPANSPTGGGARNLPDGGCAQSTGFRMAEDWPVDHDLTLPGAPGQASGIFGFGFYLQVADASRFVDLSNPAALTIGRPSNICYLATHPGYSSPECTAIRLLPGMVTWDDTRSPWKGAIRLVHFNQYSLDDPSGRVRWYTDVYGKNASTAPDPQNGIVIEQLLRGNFAEVNEGPQIGRDFSHPTVHAPN
jgi:hypothetical protein